MMPANGRDRFFGGRPATAGPARSWNLVLLLGSLVAGQGAIFTVQTHLVFIGRLDRLASFGIAFSIAILAAQIIDFGALSTLSRRTSSAVLDGAGWRLTMWRALWSASVLRVSLALMIAGLALGYALTVAGPFERGYIICALPAALLWSFNPSGLLDGLRMSGPSGIAGIAPYLSSALALYFTIDLPPEFAGTVLGGALAAGYASAVLGQFAYLSAVGEPPLLAGPTREEVSAFARDGGAVMLATLPGQLFFRAQLLVAGAFLGEQATALFLYAKQVLAGTGQVCAIVLRTELPEMTTTGRRARWPGARAVIRTHWLASGLAVALSIVIVAAAGAVVLTNPALAPAAVAVLTFAPLILMTGIGLTLYTALLAIGRQGAAWRIMAGAALAGAIASVPLAPLLGITGLAIAEALQWILILWAAAIVLGRRHGDKEPGAHG